MNLFAGPQWRNRPRKQTYEPRKRAGEGEIYGESNIETYITICKIDSQEGNLLYDSGTQTRAL